MNKEASNSLHIQYNHHTKITDVQYDVLVTWLCNLGVCVCMCVYIIYSGV